MNEGIVAFLRGIDSYDTNWNETRVPNQVRTQFFENLVDIAAPFTGNVPAMPRLEVSQTAK